MALKKYRFIGSSVDYWIPDWIEVKVAIVDHSRVRSYEKHHDHYLTTWHDTGNPNTDADAEYRFLAAGRPGVGAGGYNFIFDDSVIYQCTPLDESTWHAGTPKGNHYSWGAEQAWGTGVNFERSLEVGAALHGALCAAQGWDVTKAMVQHNYWYGKDCPGQIRHKGLWPRVVKMTVEAAARATAAAAGEDVGEAAKQAIDYVDPVKPSFHDELIKDGVPYVRSNDMLWYRSGEVYRTKESTPRQLFAVEDDRRVGPDIPAGAEFRSFAIGESRSSKTPWVITPMLTRVAMDDLEYVGESED